MPPSFPLSDDDFEALAIRTLAGEAISLSDKGTLRQELAANEPRREEYAALQETLGALRTVAPALRAMVADGEGSVAGWVGPKKGALPAEGLPISTLLITPPASDTSTHASDSQVFTPLPERRIKELAAAVRLHFHSTQTETAENTKEAVPLQNETIPNPAKPLKANPFVRRMTETKREAMCSPEVALFRFRKPIDLEEHEVAKRLMHPFLLGSPTTPLDALQQDLTDALNNASAAQQDQRDARVAPRELSLPQQTALYSTFFAPRKRNFAAPGSQSARVRRNIPSTASWKAGLTLKKWVKPGIALAVACLLILGTGLSILNQGSSREYIEIGLFNEPIVRGTQPMLRAPVVPTVRVRMFKNNREFERWLGTSIESDVKIRLWIDEAANVFRIIYPASWFVGSHEETRPLPSDPRQREVALKELVRRLDQIP